MTDRRSNGGTFNTVLIALEWACVLGALGLFTITETYQSSVNLGLGLLAAFIVLRTVRGRTWPYWTGLEIPLILFISSAAIATWISYNQAGAFLQFARMLGALAIFIALSDSSLLEQRLLAWGFILATAALAVYWPIQHDFVAQPAKYEPVQALALWLESHLPAMDLAQLTGPSIHPNIAAGVMSMGVIFAVCLAWDQWRVGLSLAAILAALAGALIMLGVLLTTSRGAWLGLAAALGLGVFIGLQRRYFAQRAIEGEQRTRQKAWIWGGAALIALVSAYVILSTGSLERLAGQVYGAAGALQSRTDLWRQGWSLAKDYLFTGSGLATFWMVHATYGILIHTPFIAHTHNTFLEVWIEQGIIGVLALIWGAVAVISWAWKGVDRQSVSPLGWAGLLSLAGMAAHSLFDVPFYIERTLPLVGMALGYAWLVVRPESGEASVPRRLNARLAWIGLVGIVLIVMGGAVFRRSLLSAWYANLGALEQTRLELAAYDPADSDGPTMDQVRRMIDLSKAEAYFQQALDWQATNRTALQRSSQIDLSQGKYEAALAETQAAWDAGFRDDITRLLYGDALVSAGQPEQAVQVISGLTWAETRLLGQAWYRYWINQDYRRAADAWRAVFLINPQNQQAVQWQAEAEKKLAQP